jgi:thiamine pyrophosphate-dependent acetolactate synthase large subunit-like protein
VGQGAQGAARQVRALAQRLNAPVLCTSSGRGVVPDTDPRLFMQDFSTGLGNVVPDLIERSDLVLALGCKFTHNGSAGGRLSLPESKLVRVDASREVLAANYPAKLAIAARVEDVLDGLEPATLAVSQRTPRLRGIADSAAARYVRCHPAGARAGRPHAVAPR